MTEAEKNYLKQFVYLLQYYNVFLISVGSYIDGHYSIFKENGKWIVLYGNHGIISEFKEENSVESAVRYLINIISEDETQQMQMMKKLQNVVKN